MSEELKCPYCEGTASIAYHRTGNNLLYCHDCKRTFSERDAKIMKQAARIAELEAECDRLREALQEIKHVPCRKEGGMYDSDGDWYVNECSSCRRMHDIAREALKGAGE